MTGIKRILTLFTMLLCCGAMQAQIADTVDVQHYDITLDLSNGTPFHGKAVLTMQLVQPCNEIALDLYGTVDSMFIDGQRLSGTNIRHIATAGIAAGQAFTLTIHYRGSGYVENYGFGGIHFDNDMTYNLGAAFGDPLHSIGSAVFPCRDNYNDKATYTLRIKARHGWSAECSGMLQSRTVDTDGCELSIWNIEHPVCTYLVGIGQADFHRINTTAGGIPVTIGYTTQDSAVTANVYALLDAVVPKFEQCFGPYRWGRIGYIGTALGSMEHVNNIALARQAMASVTQAGQSTIAHELGHAWFGNLVTCETEGDMWINEGGATFTSEVAREATHGRGASDATYQQNLDNVLRTAHHDDGAYRPLHNMPHAYTYGTTTYEKGGLVWHSLRGYLGDSLFYSTIRTLMDRCAFTSIDAYRLRDSLSAYSGVDLTGFFNFHVFSPGFVDYHLDLFGDTLHIRQQSIGTTATSRSNRVPVTFLSSDGRAEKRWFAFSGTDTTVLLAGLPFTPAYCILDRDCEISDAATRDEVTIIADVQRTFNHAHFALSAYGVGRPSTVCVEHHWGRPYGLDTVEGVIRTAGRYWVVNGDFDYPTGISGRFGYSRTNNLDDGFYELADELNSIVLMHRYDSRSPWQCVSRRHTSNADGYFNCILLPGEYTLAMVDTAVVAIPEVETIPLTLFPNPLKQGEALTINAPVNGRYNVTIVDSAGRRVWRKKGKIGVP